MMNKTDRRVLRTRRMLRDALFSLVMEKDYSAITIKEIAERADVAYITFFRHYDSIDELLVEGLAEGLLELQSRIERVTREAQELPGGVSEGRVIFEHVQERKELYTILLNSQGAHQIRKRVRDTIAGLFQTTCRPLQTNQGIVSGEVAANHIAASILALIEWWLDQDLRYPVERMAQIYYTLILRATLDTVAATGGERVS
jgi:AcrR family transcriptional regulator